MTTLTVTAFQNCGGKFESTSITTLASEETKKSDWELGKTSCETQDLATYRPSLLTKAEIMNVLGDLVPATLSSVALQAKIKELPEISIDALADQTVYIENNSIPPVGAAYSEKLMDVAEQLSAVLKNENSYRTYCTAPGTSKIRCLGYLKSFIAKLWRRPLTVPENSLIDIVAQSGSTIDAITLNHLMLAIVAPQFFLKNHVPQSAETILNFESYMLANRLSFFLYNSLPDDALMASAASGELSQPEIIKAHVDRLLSDEKYARRFAQYTLGPWISLEKDLKSDAFVLVNNVKLFAVKQAADALLLNLTRITKENLPMGEFIYGKHLYINAPIAKYLQIQNPPTNLALAKVAANPQMIASYFTNPLFARDTITSATSTSTLVSTRGRFMLEKFFCQAVPPNEVDPAIIESALAGATLQTEIGEIRRKHPACLNCHGVLDKLGMGVEYLDTFGRRRSTYEGKEAIQMNFYLDEQNEKPVSDLASFLQSLSQDRRLHSCFLKTISSKVAPMMLTAPQPCIEDIAARTPGTGIRDYVKELVTSKLFTQVRRSE